MLEKSQPIVDRYTIPGVCLRQDRAWLLNALRGNNKTHIL